MRWLLFALCAGCGGNVVTVVEGQGGGAEQVRARLADPESLTGGELVLREEWFTDVVPPGGGTNTWRGVLDARALRWSVRFDVDSGEDSESSGEVERPRGADRFVDAVRALERSGWLELEPGPPDPDVAFFEGHGFAVELRLQTARSLVHATMDLPYAVAHEKRYTDQVAAFREAGRILGGEHPAAVPAPGR